MWPFCRASFNFTICSFRKSYSSFGMSSKTWRFWFFLRCLRVASLNAIPIWYVRRKPSKIVYSDASGSACGSLIEFEGKMFHQDWSDFEKAQSSTFRELLAVSLSMKAFAESLKAQTVTWFKDNQNVVRIFNSGSKTPALQELVMDIYRSCLLNGVKCICHKKPTTYVRGP